MATQPDNRSASPESENERKPLLPERFTPDLGHGHYVREYLRALSDLILAGRRFRFEKFDRGRDVEDGPEIVAITVYAEKTDLDAAHLEVRRRMLAGDEDYVIKMPPPAPRFTGGRKRR